MRLGAPAERAEGVQAPIAPAGPAPWRRVARAWGATRLALATILLFAATPLGGGLVERFLRASAIGDSGWYIVVSRLGYEVGPPSVTHAFLPGFPLALRAVGVVIPSPTLAGLAIAATAGWFAVTALWRLCAPEVGADGAGRAVCYFVAFPFAVFLFVGYTEALFLALGFWALVAARERRWMLATVLATGATMTRTVGLAVALTVVVEWWLWRRAAKGPWTTAVALSAPFVALAVHVAWLHHLTGRWDAYTAAQRNVWHAGAAPPWEGFLNLALGRVEPAPWGPFAYVAAGAVVVGAALTIGFARRKRLADATLLGVSTVLVASSASYAAASRTALLWWPVFAGLAAATQARPALHRRLLGWGAGVLAFTAVCAFSGVNVG